jgi:hypothetical protein
VEVLVSESATKPKSPSPSHCQQSTFDTEALADLPRTMTAPILSIDTQHEDMIVRC